MNPGIVFFTIVICILLTGIIFALMEVMYKIREAGKNRDLNMDGGDGAMESSLPLQSGNSPTEVDEDVNGIGGVQSTTTGSTGDDASDGMELAPKNGLGATEIV